MIEYKIDDLYEMNLKQYKIGTVVHVSKTNKVTCDTIGHIVGFDTNSVGEILLQIKFANGINFAPYHPSKVTVL